MTALFALALFASPSVLAAEAPSAEAILVEGTVECRASETEPWRRVETGARLSPGTRIETRAASRARLRLADGSLLLLDPKSALTVEELGSSEGGGLKARLKLFTGVLWANIQKLANRPDVRVSAGGSVIGVRGTNFSVESTDDQSFDVSVSEGTVAVEETTSTGTNEEREVPAGFRTRLRSVKSELKELTHEQKERFLHMWEFVPEVRDRLKGGFKKGAHRVGDKAREGKSYVKEKGKALGRGIKGFFRRSTPTPGSVSPTALPA